MSADGIPSEWYFITPPQSVGWKKDSNSSEIDTYGTNNPYLQYGTTKLRSLTLGDTLIEGFSDGKAVEDNVVKLEACMRMVLDEENGYTSPYCWKAFAGDKCYGTFLITGVKIKEEMRDSRGMATRAKADIELQEVPSYQVSSGIDITAQAIQGKADEKYAKDVEAMGKANSQDKKVNDTKTQGNNATGQGGTGAGATGSSAGGGGASAGGGGNSAAAPSASGGGGAGGGGTQRPAAVAPRDPRRAMNYGVPE